MLKLSDRELEKGLPLVDTVERGQRTFDKEGWVLFENAFDRDYILNLRRDFFERYAGWSEEELLEVGTKVGDERFMFAPQLEAPFLDEHLFANPFVFPVVQKLLGDDFVLDSVAFVVSYPGAKEQHLHLDHSLLFPEDETRSMQVPAYAMTLVVPLVDVGERAGSTRVFEKTDRAVPSLLDTLIGGQVVKAKTGACWLMDYRLAHCGTENRGNLPRPILYLVYGRKWFLDAENFYGRPRLQVKGEVPEAYRGLFRRARGTESA